MGFSFLKSSNNNNKAMKDNSNNSSGNKSSSPPSSPKRQLSRSPRGRQHSSKTTTKHLSDQDIDQIYCYVQHMKQNKIRESMLEDFVVLQAEQHLQGYSNNHIKNKQDDDLPKSIVVPGCATRKDH